MVKESWYIQKGNPTYRRFFIRAAFESPFQHRKIWDEVIYDKLDNSSQWSYDFYEHPTQLSRYSVSLVTRQRFAKKTMVPVRIEMFRDGFHISLIAGGNISVLEASALFKALFGDPNRSTMWTQEAEKVAPMTNELIEKIKKYYSITPS